MDGGGGNGSGSYRVTRARDMAAYDQLPPGFRKVYASANHDYAATLALTRLRRGSSAKDLADIIEEEDARIAAKYYRQLERKRVH